jgi:hypothetical protein
MSIVARIRSVQIWLVGRQGSEPVLRREYPPVFSDPRSPIQTIQHTDRIC